MYQNILLEEYSPAEEEEEVPKLYLARHSEEDVGLFAVGSLFIGMKTIELDQSCFRSSPRGIPDEPDQTNLERSKGVELVRSPLAQSMSSSC